MSNENSEPAMEIGRNQPLRLDLESKKNPEGFEGVLYGSARVDPPWLDQIARSEKEDAKRAIAQKEEASKKRGKEG